MNQCSDAHALLSKLYNSILHGNEIQFQYNNKQYYILPNYDKNKIEGVCFGEAYTENEIVCLSATELYDARIENTILGKVASHINIVWRNF